MSQKRFPSWAVSMFVAFLWLWPQATAALVITDARLSLSLQITGPPSGILLDPVTTDAFAQAQNSLGEAKAQFDTRFDAPSNANALVTWANGFGTASTDLTTAAETHINLPGTLNAASAEGLGDFFTFFILPSDPSITMVDVTFVLAVTGFLHGFADSLGSFHSELIPFLGIDGDAFVLFDDFIFEGGPNFPDTTVPINTTLAGTFSLSTNMPHFLLVSAQAESRAQNLSEPLSEPAALALVLAGLGGLAWRRSRTKLPHSTRMGS